jgi:hypothetical protein
VIPQWDSSIKVDSGLIQQLPRVISWLGSIATLLMQRHQADRLVGAERDKCCDSN